MMVHAENRHLEPGITENGSEPKWVIVRLQSVYPKQL